MSGMSDFLVRVQNPDFAQSNALMKTGLTAITEAADPFKDAMNQHYKDNAKRVTDAALNYIKTNDMNNPNNQAGLQKLMDASGFVNAGGNLGELGTAITENKKSYAETQRGYDALDDTHFAEDVANKIATGQITEDVAKQLLNNRNWKTSFQGASIAATAPQREVAAKNISTLIALGNQMNPANNPSEETIKSIADTLRELAEMQGNASGAASMLSNGGGGGTSTGGNYSFN